MGGIFLKQKVGIGTQIILLWGITDSVARGSMIVEIISTTFYSEKDFKETIERFNRDNSNPNPYSNNYKWNKYVLRKLTDYPTLKLKPYPLAKKVSVW